MTKATATHPPDQGFLSATDEEFELFRKLIHKRTGIHLKDGKRTMLAARLAKRLRRLGLATLAEYYSLLGRQDPRGEELDQMINAITTNKTSFFREAHHFQYLGKWLTSRVHEPGARAANRRLRIWSVACSSGEEPYSIAITVSETLQAANGGDVSILASDIDTNMLERAQAGTYEEANLEGVSDELKRKYFLRGKGNCAGLVQVKPDLRRMVVCRRINLIEEPWPVRTRFDAIFCRNVIIYFDRDTQRRLFERLLQHLEPDGRLFVGHSESLYWLTDLVTPVEHTVYRHRIPVAGEPA